MSKAPACLAGLVLAALSSAAAAQPSPEAASVLEVPPAAPASAGDLVAFSTRDEPTQLMVSSNRSALAAGLLGPIGAVGAAISDAERGHKIQVMNNIEDPSGKIAAALASAYAAEHKATPAGVALLIKDNHPDQIAAQAKGARYVVDVATIGWNVVYFPFDWIHYGLNYMAKVRLIDGASGKVLAEGKCHVKPQKSEHAPGFDEFTGNGAVLLKAAITAAADHCTNEFGAKALHLASVTPSAPAAGN